MAREIIPLDLETNAARAANVQAMLARGFFNSDAMREHREARLAALRGHSADAADLVGGAVEHDGGKPITAMPGGVGLVPQPEGGFVAAAGEDQSHGGMMWQRLMVASRWLDDHWIGDLIGVLSLFGGLWLGLMIAEVLQ